MERPATLEEKTPVRDVLGERVFERVLRPGKKSRRVQELRRLQLGEPALERGGGAAAESGQELDRHVLTDDRGGLEEALLVRRKTIDAGGEHRLDGGRHLHRIDRAGDA